MIGDNIYEEKGASPRGNCPEFPDSSKRRQWLAIDPKGVVGEAEFEIAAFDFMYISELAKKIMQRISLKLGSLCLLRKQILSYNELKIGCLFVLF